ncbi:hypothetical protein ACNQFZ_06610 [Schinkia sp. CFF1]
MKKSSVDPKELYLLVDEFNRMQFILRKAISERNFILASYYGREVTRLRNVALKKYNIVLDEM